MMDENTPHLRFVKLVEADLPEVTELYNYYLRTTTATFRLEPVSPDVLRTFVYLDHPRYSAYMIHAGREPAGFCFLTQHHPQPAYDRTAAIGIYLKPGFTGRGLGGEAVRHLEQVAAACSIRVLIASISGENTASLKLFRKMGYEQCAHFRRVGEKFGRLLDVVFLQKFLDS